VTHAYPFDHQHGLPLADVKAVIGSKAANIAVMVNELGLPVPRGFTITTATCREFLATGWPEGLDAEVEAHMRRLEESVGRRFGDPSDPLLVSVRSGAPISMPGMMDTILNLGLNDATTAGLAAVSGHPDFAAACRARFETMYRGIVGGDAVPNDPWHQLRGAVEAVFRSWNSDRARAYRAHEGIPDDLGTAVTVQAMVFGNVSRDSGTGVLFTRDPATGEPALYGDVLFDAQGEDVVAGTHHTEPISILDERLPAVAAELRGYAHALERHYADLCDIEFTIERGTLWLLQVRVGKRSPQAALRIAVDMAESPEFPLTREEAVRRVAGVLAEPPTVVTERRTDIAPLARGLPASPGIACGEVATTPEAAVAVADAGRPVILVRAETSPDDVHGMARATGILTVTGGLASHAAVVARGWGIPAVVGAADVEVRDEAIIVAGTRIAVGETVTIDGGTGEVFAGTVGGHRKVVPEAATLLAWARELGIAIDESGSSVGATAADPGPSVGATAADPAGGGLEAGPTERDAVLRAVLIKGFVLPPSLASATLSTPDEMAAALDRLVEDGLAEMGAGQFRLSADGKAIARDLIAADRDAWGADAAAAALDEFLALDHRMKETVTAWQLREVDGAQVLNDHADPTHDARVLDMLAALHADADGWLAPLAERLPRLATYRARLQRASDLVAGGDNRYIASPRPDVDSYHSAWFELHEDLILLAGRSREAEVAAGRA
jgi:pyruvate,orthophosphate dikinase